MAELKKCKKNDVDEMLINAVKARPALYDTSIPIEQRHKAIKHGLWQDVSDLLSGELDAEAAESRWKYLRENYLKARNKLKIQEDIAKQKGIHFKKRYAFRYHQAMEFLEDALKYQNSFTLKSINKAKDRLSRSHPIKNKVSIDPSSHKSPKKSNESSLRFKAVNNTNNSMKEQDGNNSEDDMEIENASQNIPPSRMKLNYDKMFLECLQKPIETISPIDGFLMRLGEGLKKLPYKERSKLELEFLSRLNEVEEESLYSD